MKNHSKGDVLVPFANERKASGFDKSRIRDPIQNQNIFSKNKRKSSTPRHIIKKRLRHFRDTCLNPMQLTEIENIDNTKINKIPTNYNEDPASQQYINFKILSHLDEKQINILATKIARSEEITSERTLKPKNKISQNKKIEKVFSDYDEEFMSKLTKIHIDLDLRFKNIEQRLDSIYNLIKS